MTALIVCGVAGAGKSTVAAAVATTNGWVYLDGDDFHSSASIERMRRGEPLADAARMPWLAAILDAVAEQLRAGARVIVACSALTRAHRDALRSPDLDVRFLQLSIPQGTSLARLQVRSGHFAGPELAASQHASLQPLQPDEPGMTIDGTMHLDQLIAAATAYVINGIMPATDSWGQ